MFQSLEYGDPDGDRSLMQYLKDGYFPVNAPVELAIPWLRKPSPSQVELMKQARIDGLSLREIARKNGLSHEAFRSALAASD